MLKHLVMPFLRDGEPTPVSSAPAVINAPAPDPTGAPVTVDIPPGARKATTTKAGKVSLKREPTAEELSTDFNADLSLLGREVDEITEKPTAPEPGVTKPAVKPVAAPKGDGQDKVNVPAAQPQPKVDATPKKSLTAGPVGVPKATPTQRDLTGFTPEEQHVLKNMSTEAYEYTSKVIREHKELSQLRTGTFLQHPEAYQLDPQYKQLTSSVQHYDAIAGFLKEQLQLCADGKEWHTITHWDDKGQPVFSGPLKPSAVAQVNIQHALQQHMVKGEAARNEMQQYAGNYQQRIQQDAAGIKKVMGQHCSWVANPEEMKQSLTIPGKGDVTLQQMYDEFTGQFPIYMRHSPGIDVAANLWIAFNIYGSMIRDLENGKQLAEVKAEEALKVEPSSGLTAPAAKKDANGNVSEFKTPSFMKF